jgi:hypothetical protein
MHIAGFGVKNLIYSSGASPQTDKRVNPSIVRQAGLVAFLQLPNTKPMPANVRDYPRAGRLQRQRRAVHAFFRRNLTEDDLAGSGSIKHAGGCENRCRMCLPVGRRLRTCSEQGFTGFVYALLARLRLGAPALGLHSLSQFVLQFALVVRFCEFYRQRYREARPRSRPAAISYR